MKLGGNMTLYLILLLVACCNWEYVKGLSTTEDITLHQETECDCGIHGNCTIENNQPICICDFGFAEIDGSCEVCNCGRNGNCTFTRGVKECHCQFGYYEKHGVCRALPVPEFKVSYMASTFIVFEAVKQQTEDLEITFYEAEYSEMGSSFIHQKQWSVARKNYTLSDLNKSADYRIRFRSVTNMGPSEWSEWRWYQLRDAEVPDAPVIVQPRNYDLLPQGGITVVFRESDNNRSPITHFEVRLYERDGNSSSWIRKHTYPISYRDRWNNWMGFNLWSRGNYRIDIVAFNGDIPGKIARVEFTVDGPFSYPILIEQLVFAVVGILLIVSVSFCIYCGVKRRKESRKK